jgi:hypothetical protein
LNDDAWFYIASSPFVPIASSYTVNLWVKTLSGNQTFYQFANGSGMNISDSKVFGIDVSALLLDGAWHMFTITKASSGSSRLYIDKVNRATTNSGFGTSSTSALYLGKGFIGKMDNLRIYNRALTTSEIETIFNAKQ